MQADADSREPTLGVGLAGLGAVGRTVLEALEVGLPGYHLAGIAVRREERARAFLDEVGTQAKLLDLDALVDASDIVVEALPPTLFRQLATRVVDQGKELVVLSIGALLEHWDLVEAAERSGARILVPSGAILGLDAVQAAAQGEIHSITMITRKPTKGLAGAPFLDGREVDITTITEPLQLFEGTAREAITGFPANLNVAVALSLVGLGPDRTRLEVWADPALERNTHHVEVESDSARLQFSIENIPTEENPRTGRITALSIVALLRKRTASLAIGT